MIDEPRNIPSDSIPEEKPALSEFTPDEIAERLGVKSFQGRQIFRWLHYKRVVNFDAMSDLSKDLRRVLNESYVPVQLKVARQLESPRSGTKKILFQLRDGHTIESVLIKDRERITLCLSSQVGCQFRCSFCATGRDGFTRNLTAGEIVEQVLHMLAGQDIELRTPNIVYMGMGEPFRNYEAVTKSIKMLMMKEGVGIGARKITVSTAGDVPGIRRFAQEGWQVRLAISLHAADDALRSKLVPLNRKYPLDTLMEAVRHYAAVTGRQVSFEWALFKGVNDSPGNAEELARLIQGLDAVVNLIPYNPVEGAEYAPPSQTVCKAFRDVLTKCGVTATLRMEKGRDIDAACGQLRARHVSER